MKHATYSYLKRQTGLGDYQLLPSQENGECCQVACHPPPNEKQHTTRGRQSQFIFWATAICCITTMMQVQSSQSYTWYRYQTTADIEDRVPFFLLITVLLPNALNSYGTSCSMFEKRFNSHGNSKYNAAMWSAEISSHVFPVTCHSHNDYWRPHPLLSALAVGCASVEADVWLSPNGEDLLVGHDKRSLSSRRTLRSMYIDPLLQILNSVNRPELHKGFNIADQPHGVYLTDLTEPNTTLILFIDVKDDPEKTWPLVLQQLEPLRDMGYLSRHDKTMNRNQSFWPGPITVVGTGSIVQRRDINMGPDLEDWLQRHDAFLDAPLHLLTETGFSHGDEFYGDYELENEFYSASAPFSKAIGSVRTGFNDHQMETLRNQLRIAKERNLKSRLWGLPSWPISYTDYVWEILEREGLDLLNADNIASAAMKY
ncbi:hypothetical protein FSST1_010253 [Fusarium sambucinum]